MPITHVGARPLTSLYAGTTRIYQAGPPATPTLAIATAGSITEGNSGTTNFVFTVTRTGPGTPCSASWAVTGYGANPADAADFVGGVLPSGTVNFALDQTTATITVQVQGDTTVEDNETFAVTLSAPVDCTLGTAQAVATIVNDDAPPSVPTFTIVATSADKNEGNSGTTAFTFTVTRSGSDLSLSSSATWTVTGTGSNPANASDFVGGTFPSGIVSFGPNETSKVITVNVQGDTAVEPDEQFTVTLTSFVNAVMPNPAVIGTIRNDDSSSTYGPAAVPSTLSGWRVDEYIDFADPATTRTGTSTENRNIFRNDAGRAVIASRADFKNAKQANVVLAPGVGLQCRARAGYASSGGDAGTSTVLMTGNHKIPSEGLYVFNAPYALEIEMAWEFPNQQPGFVTPWVYGNGNVSIGNGWTIQPEEDLLEISNSDGSYGGTNWRGVKPKHGWTTNSHYWLRGTNIPDNQKFTIDRRSTNSTPATQLPHQDGQMHRWRLEVYQSGGEWQRRALFDDGLFQSYTVEQVAANGWNKTGNPPGVPTPTSLIPTYMNAPRHFLFWLFTTVQTVGGLNAGAGGDPCPYDVNALIRRITFFKPS